MSYATRFDLVDRFGEDEIAQRESMLPVGAVDKRLADADSQIDSCLAVRYPVPVTPTPDLVKRLACDIAHYYLLGASITDVERTAYTDAIAMLRDLASGKMRLLDVEPVAGGRASSMVEYSSCDRVFQRKRRGGL